MKRLTEVFPEPPVFFVTTTTLHRRACLAQPEIARILTNEWVCAESRHGWIVGRYVIMPDHVHFFCAPRGDASPLARFVGKWKEWTTKRAILSLGPNTRLWQREFFDHVLRSGDSYSAKWIYVRENPVRAGLVAHPDDWPFQGEIQPIQGWMS